MAIGDDNAHCPPLLQDPTKGSVQEPDAGQLVNSNDCPGNCRTSNTFPKKINSSLKPQSPVPPPMPPPPQRALRGVTQMRAPSTQVSSHREKTLRRGLDG